MEMKWENVPDELLIQAKVVRAVINSNKYAIHCLRNLGNLYDWFRHPNNASR